MAPSPPSVLAGAPWPKVSSRQHEGDTASLSGAQTEEGTWARWARKDGPMETTGGTMGTELPGAKALGQDSPRLAQALATSCVSRGAAVSRLRRSRPPSAGRGCTPCGPATLPCSFLPHRGPWLRCDWFLSDCSKAVFSPTAAPLRGTGEGVCVPGTGSASVSPPLPEVPELQHTRTHTLTQADTCTCTHTRHTQTLSRTHPHTHTCTPLPDLVEEGAAGKGSTFVQLGSSPPGGLPFAAIKVTF